MDGLLVTETTVTVVADWLPNDWPETPAGVALLGWLGRHGLDPRMMPAGQAIVRDVEAMQVRCVYLVPADPDWEAKGHRFPTGLRDLESPDGFAEQTVPHVAQLDRVPEPWPSEVWG